MQDIQHPTQQHALGLPVVMARERPMVRPALPLAPEGSTKAEQQQTKSAAAARTSAVRIVDILLARVGLGPGGPVPVSVHVHVRWNNGQSVSSKAPIDRRTGPINHARPLWGCVSISVDLMRASEGPESASIPPQGDLTRPLARVPPPRVAVRSALDSAQHKAEAETWAETSMDQNDDGPTPLRALCTWPCDHMLYVSSINRALIHPTQPLTQSTGAAAWGARLGLRPCGGHGITGLPPSSSCWRRR